MPKERDKADTDTHTHKNGEDSFPPPGVQRDSGAGKGMRLTCVKIQYEVVIFVRRFWVQVENTTTKGSRFIFNSSFNADNSFSIPNQNCSKPSLNLKNTFHIQTHHAGYNFENNILPNDIFLSDNEKVHFINKFKYLGSFITPILHKNSNYQLLYFKRNSNIHWKKKMRTDDNLCPKKI